jgi:hypothetical protein
MQIEIRAHSSIDLPGHRPDAPSIAIHDLDLQLSAKG